MMADLARIKRNVAKMAAQNAPVEDIDGYIASEGVTVDDVRNFKDAVSQATSEMSAMTQALDKGPEGNPVADRQRAQYDALPEWQKPIVAAGDTLQLFANGATMGFGDKAVAGARSLFTDKTYEQELADARTKTQEARNRAGYAGTGAEVVGAVATPMKLAGKGATLAGRFGTAAMTGAPGVLARTGLMAVEGGGYGALTAAGNDQDITTGAGIGAVGGGLGNLAGEAISAGVSKVAGKFNPKVPQMGVDDLMAAKNAAYQQADQAGVVFTPSAMTRLRDDVTQEFAKKAYHPKLQPKMAVVLEELDRLTSQNVTLEGLDTARQIASDAFEAGNKKNNMLLSVVIDKIDNLMASPRSGDILMGDHQAGAEALKQARKFYHQARKLDTINTFINKGELIGGSQKNQDIAGATQRQIRTILTNEGKARGFTKPELEAARKAVMGTGTQRAAHAIGGLFPRDRLSSAVHAVGGLGTAAVSGGATIPLQVGAMVAGYGAQKTSQWLANKSVAELVSIISSGGVPQPIMKNAIQLLAESKRDALTRALMAIAVNRGNAGYNEPSHQYQK